MFGDPSVLILYAVVLGGLGLVVGSFLNVVIYRVPAGVSVVRPRSACGSCHAPIAARDNVPVASWVLLRGRCRQCGDGISARYPLVEIGTAATWLAVGWWSLRPDGVDRLLPLLLVLCAAAVALTMIDLDHHRLPDAIVLPLYPVTIGGLVLAGVLGGTWNVAGSVASALLWGGLVGGLWWATAGRGMGLGDVKLAPVLGAALGWVAFSAALVGLLAAFVLGAVVGVAMLAFTGAGPRSRLPFGPFLFAGAAVGLVWGPSLLDAYQGWLGR